MKKVRKWGLKHTNLKSRQTRLQTSDLSLSARSERILGTLANQDEEFRGSKVTRKSLSDEGS